jgi:hypothetical protein
MTPVMLLLGYTIMTLIFLLAFKLMDAGITYRKSFTATIWGLGPPGIVVTLLSLLFISIKDPESLDINYINNVVSNLGILAESETHPALNALLSSFDLFTIWTVVLLSMGFAAMSEGKLAVRKAATPIVSLWVLWVVLKTGFWALLG